MEREQVLENLDEQILGDLNIADLSRQYRIYLINQTKKGILRQLFCASCGHGECGRIAFNRHLEKLCSAGVCNTSAEEEVSGLLSSFKSRHHDYQKVLWQSYRRALLEIQGTVLQYRRGLWDNIEREASSKGVPVGEEAHGAASERS